MNELNDHRACVHALTHATTKVNVFLLKNGDLK